MNIRKRIFQTILAMCISSMAVVQVLADDVNDKKIKVFPNPVERSAVTTIEIPENRSEMTVVLYNTVGKVIQTFQSSNNRIDFTAPDISGIYLLRFVENQKVVAVEKIVVKE